MSKKEDKELQKYINNLKVKGKSLFYPPGYGITEDVAVQKLILLADSILQLSELQNSNFKILFGYKALNKLISEVPTMKTYICTYELKSFLKEKQKVKIS